MDKKEFYDNCEKCGRPMHYAPVSKCKYNNCCLDEYSGIRSACIRKKQPDCTAKAVIPATTVETVDGITNLANCFVHVTSINTTFYIDDKHRPIITWAGDVEVDLPSNIETEEEFMNFVKSYNLRSQFLYVRFFQQEAEHYIIDAFYFDKKGKVYYAGQYEEVGELV